MRTPVVLAAFALAACGSEAPSPLERQQMERDRAEAAKREAAPVVLNGDGLVVDGTVIRFSSERAAVEEALGALFENEAQTGENRECGAGPMEFATFDNSLTANFQNGFFVGWLASKPDRRVTAANGAGVGMEESRVAPQPGFQRLEQSTLEGEFLLGDKMGGFLRDGQVDTLYAGVNCFFR